MSDRKLKKAGPRTKVRALQQGFYGASLRRVGEEFYLKEGDNIVHWMEEVEADAPKARAPKAPKPAETPEDEKPEDEKPPAETSLA